MLLVEKKAKLKWNPANKNKYVDMGYIYTKMADTFTVDINHLTPTTRALVFMKCDYCGTIKEILYKTYTLNLKRSHTKKDCCDNQECINKKMIESNLDKYGVESSNTSPKVKAKKIKVMQERYGVKNPSQVREFRVKVANTNLQRYGYDNPFNSKEIQDNLSGENHYAWNPNLTDEERINKRNYLEYDKWRKQVYERDGYICQCCGESKKYLNAHHKDGYHWCKDRRLDIDNGVTLCEECHLNFHSKYGRKNNTEKQFKEFILNYNNNIDKERSA